MSVTGFQSFSFTVFLSLKVSSFEYKSFLFCISPRNGIFQKTFIYNLLKWCAMCRFENIFLSYLRLNLQPADIITSALFYGFLLEDFFILRFMGSHFFQLINFRIVHRLLRAQAVSYSLA